MRTGKILGAVVGGLAALLVAALLTVWLLVNPNDYKPRIAAAVRDATGRDLVLKGDIKLSVFPWIALQLGPASLGNPPGFSEQPFLSFKHAAVRAKFLPLLAKRLEIGRVEVDGLDLRLLKNAEGKGNWEDFGRSEDGKAPAGEQAKAKAGEALQGIAGILLTNARIQYQDIRIENLNAETGSFVEKGVVPVALRFDINRLPTDHGSVDARFDLSADLSRKRFRIAALNMNSVTTLADDRPVRVSLSAPAIDIDVPAQTLSAPAFGLNAAGAQVNGKIQVASMIDAMSMTGSVSLAPLVVREYLPRVGAPSPRSRDPRAFSLVTASSDFAYGGNALRFDKLLATLDDTHLSGQVDIVDLASHAVTFEVSVDSIDVDRYLAPPGPPGAPQSGAAQEAARAGAGTARPSEAKSEGASKAEWAGKADGAEKSEVAGKAEAAAKPDAGKPWQANGTLAVGSVHLAPLDLSSVRVTLASADRVMHFFPLKAQIDGGRYSGDITLDSRGGTPTLSLDEHLSGVDVGKLLAAQSKTVHVTGRGNVNLKATGRGTGVDAIMKTLSGHFEADVTDGAVEGIDLGYELGRAEALLRQQEMPGTQNSRRTKFEAFKMSAEIANGIAVTHDLLISSQVLKVTGQGSTNLPAKTLDFALLADTLRSAGPTPIQVPVKVTGNIADPTVRPDVEALAKGELRKKLQDVLQDKLKGLFGR